MKVNFILILILIGIFSACEAPIEDYAYEWSKSVKSNIIEESHIESDRLEIDSTHENWQTITYWKGDRKLREYNYRPLEGDTVISVFYSKSQDFDLVRELCPGDERSFEGIRYKGKHLGLAEFRFCNGDLKESGFRMDGNVGIWSKYDEEGNVIDTQDFGSIDKLEKLKEIKYK